jgi:hypothetical protein
MNWGKYFAFSSLERESRIQERRNNYALEPESNSSVSKHRYNKCYMAHDQSFTSRILGMNITMTKT